MATDDMPKNKGGNPNLTGRDARPVGNDALKLSDLGITKDEVVLHSCGEHQRAMLAEEIRRLERTLGSTPERRRAQTRERVRRFRARAAKRVAAIAVLALALLHDPALAQQPDPERAIARA